MSTSLGSDGKLQNIKSKLSAGRPSDFSSHALFQPYVMSCSWELIFFAALVGITSAAPSLLPRQAATTQLTFSGAGASFSATAPVDGSNISLSKPHPICTTSLPSAQDTDKSPQQTTPWLSTSSPRLGLRAAPSKALMGRSSLYLGPTQAPQSPHLRRSCARAANSLLLLHCAEQALLVDNSSNQGPINGRPFDSSDCTFLSGGRCKYWKSKKHT